MASNFIKSERTITHVLASTGQASGTGRLIGTMFGIALTTGAVGDTVEFETVGTWELPAVSGDTPASGAKAYWDDTAKKVTTTTTSNSLIGCFEQPKASGVLVASVRLNGITI